MSWEGWGGRLDGWMARLGADNWRLNLELRRELTLSKDHSGWVLAILRGGRMSERPRVFQSSDCELTARALNFARRICTYACEGKIRYVRKAN